MESLDYWRLCEDLTIAQAAVLIAGEDPSDGWTDVENYAVSNRPVGYEAAKHALIGAVSRSSIEGIIQPEYRVGFDGRVEGAIPGSVDPYKSTVEVESLRSWLRDRGFTAGFFFAGSSDKSPYLDPKNPYYSPKLSAAVRAWEAVTTDPKYLDNGKHVKQNLVSWLTSHAAELDLLKPDGEINVDAIENQVAKVANWQDKGGAPKTPGG